MFSCNYKHINMSAIFNSEIVFFLILSWRCVITRRLMYCAHVQPLGAPCATLLSTRLWVSNGANTPPGWTAAVGFAVVLPSMLLWVQGDFKATWVFRTPIGHWLIHSLVSAICELVVPPGMVSYLHSRYRQMSCDIVGHIKLCSLHCACDG